MLFTWYYKVEEVAGYIVACWGRALSSFAFRTVTPSTAICIKMEEWGEQRGEGVGDGFREEREQDGWTDAERNKASSCPTNHMTNMVRKSISGYEIKIPVRRCMTRGYYITLNSKSSLWICADNSFWPTYIRCAWECNSSLPNTAQYSPSSQPLYMLDHHFRKQTYSCR